MTAHLNYTLPPKLAIANLPTPIEKLERFSEYYSLNVFVKRDDYTGLEISGNKIRKLEYAVAEALNQGAKVLITCGALQSNHARATAAIARKLGLEVHLVLRGDENALPEGNYLLNQLLGAKMTILPETIFAQTYENEMNSLKATYDSLGTPAYILPIGASNGIGNFGYFNAFNEILEQEKALGITFDTIVCTVGSGGTFGGLYLGNLLNDAKRNLIGINISADAAYFQNTIAQIVNDSLKMLKLDSGVQPEDIPITDGYAGLGYGISQPEEVAFIKEVARMDGLITDPVYTGKALRGLAAEIEMGNLEDAKNVLFIHTGGQLGFLPKYLY